jgi:hypothetical protein
MGLLSSSLAPEMNTLYFFLHLLLANLFIYKYSILSLRGFPQLHSMALFSAKCVFVYFLFGFSSNHPEPLDVSSYLGDATLISGMLLDDPIATLNFLFAGGPLPSGYANTNFNVWNAVQYLPFFNDNYTVVILNVIIRFVSFGFASVHLVWMTFLGWIGLCRLSKAVFPDKHGNLLVLFPFLVPQVVIWSSLVLKEPLLLFCLGFLLQGILQWAKGSKHYLRNLLTGLIGFFFVKTFILVLILPAILAFGLAKRIKKIKPVIVFIAVISMMFTVLIILSNYYQTFDLPALLYGQQLNMYRFVVYNQAGSILKPIMLAPDWLSFFKRIPESIGYALMQPLPWVYDIRHGWLVFIENCIVFCYLIYGIYSNKGHLLKSRWRLLFLTAGLTILIVSGFVAPVAGSLIRFKMPGILLLMLAVIPSHHQESLSLSGNNSSGKAL